MDKNKIPGRTWVYVLADEHERVKIGIADDLNKRQSQYKTHNPDELRLAFHQSCPRSKARRIERYAHNDLASSKKHGEWFNDTPGNAGRAVMKGMKECGQLLYNTWAWKNQFSIQSQHADKYLHDKSMDEIRDSLEPGDEDRLLGKLILRDHRFIRSRRSGDYILKVTYYTGTGEIKIVKGKVVTVRPEPTKTFEQEFTPSSAFEYVEEIFAKHPDPRMREL